MCYIIFIMVLFSSRWNSIKSWLSHAGGLGKRHFKNFLHLEPLLQLCSLWYSLTRCHQVNISTTSLERDLLQQLCNVWQLFKIFVH